MRLKAGSLEILHIWVEKAERVDLRQELRAKHVVGGAEVLHWV